MKLLGFSILFLASVSLADDFKTNRGKEYKDATVTRVEPDGIVVMTSSGISKLYFAELPPDVQTRYNYDHAKATAFATQQKDDYAKQQTAAEAAQAEQEVEKQQRQKLAAEQQAQIAARQAKQNTIDALTFRFQNLQRQEDDLLERIAEAERAEKAASQIRKRNRNYTDPLELDLPRLRSHLDDVRDDKKDVKRELARAKH